jgi:hypothetical protein
VTLLDPEAYPAEESASLYEIRWWFEEYLKALKKTMNMDGLKCRTVDGGLKELAVYAMAYDPVRLRMIEASGRQRSGVERISFIDALRWLRDGEDSEEMAELVVNPAWRGRSEPRRKKRRPKRYDLMRVPRAELRKRLREQDLAA